MIKRDVEHEATSYPPSAVSSRLFRQLPAPVYSSCSSIHCRDLLGQRTVAYSNTSWKHPSTHNRTLVDLDCLPGLSLVYDLDTELTVDSSLCVPFLLRIFCGRTLKKSLLYKCLSMRKDTLNFW